jgi:hypothetical protein
MTIQIENLERRCRYTCNFTVDQWDLYQKEGSVQVAGILNTKLAHYLNSGAPRDEVLTRMDALMENWRSYGAWDTEPRAFLNLVLDHCYSQG